MLKLIQVILILFDTDRSRIQKISKDLQNQNSLGTIKYESVSIKNESSKHENDIQGLLSESKIESNRDGIH